MVSHKRGRSNNIVGSARPGKTGIVIFVEAGGGRRDGGRGEGGGEERGSANSRDMSRLLDIMTTVEMDDDDLPLILINHLGMQRWLARRVEGGRGRGWRSTI